jgi:hypothetical protein
VRDGQRLADLIEFARLEVAAADIEPWAATIRAMTSRGTVGAAALAPERALWLLTLYNTTDDILSALTIDAHAFSPQEWRRCPPGSRRAVANVRLSGERRNLYGGRILQRMDSYATQVGDRSQAEWFASAIFSRSEPQANFDIMMTWLRRVWGVGRLSAFEWAEFLHKIHGLPVETTDGCLWESSGPRQSLERIYGRPARGTRELTDWAHTVKAEMAAAGVPLSWWDFETVICDFNVMAKGRYYPGKHLAMISEEIAGLPDQWRPAWTAAYRSVIPTPWRDLPGGVDKELCRAYATTGRIRTPLTLEAA